jgi:isopentenyldiphosphate isomerase
MQQNDPAELLEVLDSSGHPTGIAKPRAAIHVDGDWHQAFHCWIVRGGGSEVVLQRRAFEKDTFPGAWDAAAAGHWRFGETAEEAAREIAEELGLEVSFSELVYRGREEAVQHFANGLIDREFHQVYLLADDRPLATYRPDPHEVIGLAAFPTHELIDLLEGTSSTVAAIEAVAVDAEGSLRACEVIVAPEDLVAYSAARLRRTLGNISPH